MSPGAIRGSLPSPSKGGLLRRWVPVAIYVVLILTVSSIPHLRTPGFEDSDKVAHFCEYGLLGLLARRAANRPGVRGWILALAIASAIGACDELYQRLVPGRFSSAFDWMADSLGAASGAAAWSVLSGAWAARRARSVRQGEGS